MNSTKKFPRFLVPLAFLLIIVSVGVFLTSITNFKFNGSSEKVEVSNTATNSNSNPISNGTGGPEKIIGLLEWNEDAENFSYNLELFPIVVLKDGVLRGAENNEDYEFYNQNEVKQVSQNETLLSPGQNFKIPGSRGTIGEFTVQEMKYSQRMCQEAIIAKGKIEIKEKNININPALSLIAVFSNNENIQTIGYLLLPWNEEEKDKIDNNSYSSILLPNLKRKVDDQLNNYIKENSDYITANGKVSQQTQITNTETYKLASSNVIRVQAERSFVQDPNFYPQTKLKIDTWFSYKPDFSVELLNYNVSFDPGFDADNKDGSTSSLLGILDIDNDGTEEVIYKEKGYEWITYAIYSLKSPTGKPIFSKGYGC